MQPQCAHVPSAAALLSNVRLGKTATHNRILERLYYAAEVSLSPQKTQAARSMDKSASCQGYAADPRSGWGPAAPGKPIGAEPTCIELNIDVLYSTPAGGQWQAALGTTGTTTEPPYLT